MKSFLLSVDYELFFGSNSGTVENCMIRPVRRLIKELEICNCKMTVFWDIMHFYRLKELEETVKDLYYDRLIIQKQIETLISKGHDVQMLINPHWLDARWENNKWHFSYQRYSIHRLWNDDDPNDIYTIFGCITKCKNLMEEVCQAVDKNYSVRVIRTGGGRVEPFSQLKSALIANNIKIDSSYLCGFKTKSPFPVDFTKGPKCELFYRFENSIVKGDENGSFWEIPRGVIRVPFFFRVIFYLQGLFSKETYSRYGDGTPLKFSYKETWGHQWFNFRARNYRLSLEYVTPYRWKYFLKKAVDKSQLVINSKHIGPHTIRFIRAMLKNREVRFFSFKERIEELSIYEN